MLADIQTRTPSRPPPPGVTRSCTVPPGSASSAPEEEFHEVNVGGTEAVIAACRTAGVARLVVVSSPSVGYESTPTVGAGASTPITQRRDRSWYSESKGEAEIVALTANDEALAVTAIRPHAIWEPGDTQLVGRIVGAAAPGGCSSSPGAER